MLQVRRLPFLMRNVMRIIMGNVPGAAAEARLPDAPAGSTPVAAIRTTNDTGTPTLAIGADRPI